MNKKLVTLLSVAVLSAVTSGVYADEVNLGGNAPSSTDNTGLVVTEKPTESPVEKPAPKVNENLDLGGSADKAQDKDNTGVVVEPTTPSEKPKEEKTKEDKPSENLGKDSEKQQEKDNTGVVVEPKTPSDQPKEEKPAEDTPEIKEQKQKAEENVGVKEKDIPQPLNVTKEEIKETPIETNTGHKVVSTNQGKVVVETEEGDYQEKEPYEIGAVKQQDGTIALKDKEGQLKVLPNTGTASTIFATIWGLIGFIATVLGRRKLN
ncbi:LPXTG cell wall anchor domain-containing protein [Streptococcus oralis]|uniref:LPXTG cell wall anchor domain-containing protein n=1 Tax=Streptococcus oralis TaxID=1303 RepID=UPI000A0FCD9C|nr:LPXTG cell wall anchor domain-containing protein [Streptococcus oralis]ORO81978.1 cell wall anchor protein [Streptococcus oralis subsp. dentisani]